MAHDFAQSLWLGTGGRRPEVRVATSDALRAVDDVSGPAPASIYALDVNPLACAIAWATRSGDIRVLCQQNPREDHNATEPGRLFAGRAVSSLCFATGGDLFSADEAGRVLRWCRDAQGAFRSIRMDTKWFGISMLGATSNHIVGLGGDGQILIWYENAEGLEAHLVGPAPARPTSFSRLVTWTVQDRSILIYPTVGGDLAFIGTDPPFVRVVSAHQGCWYASFPVGDSLATIGHDDGRVRLWEWEGVEPVCRSIGNVAFGVVDAETFLNDPHRGVAVLSSGSAVRFSVEKNSLAVTDRVPGDDYRIVAGTSARFRRALELRKRQQRADVLQEQIVVALEQNIESDLSEAFRELEALEYHSPSLALRAHQAQQRGDRLAELEARHRLREFLHLESPRALPYIERYLTLLLEVGQFELALDVTNHIERSHPGRKIGMRPLWLADVVEAIRGSRPVVFAGLDGALYIEERIESASIVGRPPAGFLELSRSRPILLPDAAPSTADFLDSINAVQTPRSASTVCAEVVSALWVEHGVAGSVETILLAPAAATIRIRVLLRLTASPAGTELVRSILIDPGPDVVSTKHEVLRTVEEVREHGGRAPVFAPINRLLHQALGHLRGIALTQSAFERETAA